MLLTHSQAIQNKRIKEGFAWIGLCVQVMETLHYLLEEALVLHNDLT